MEDYAIIGFVKGESSVCYVSSVYASYCNFSDERQSAIHVPCDIANDVARWLIDRQQYSGREGANKKWFVETVKTYIYHNGEWFEYENDTDAFNAALELAF